MTIAYLINQYPQTSQSFIRREIEALEAAGFDVLRYSVRGVKDPLVDPGDERERQQTRAVLSSGGIGLFRAMVATLFGRPARFFQAVRLAWKFARPSERGVLVHLIYLAEACVLRGWFEEASVKHVHAHFGTNSATVAALCRALGGPPFSFTVHGPEEFDSPRALSLGEKVHRAEFVAAISEFTRSQLYRWADHADWSKIHVIRCGLDPSYLDGSRPITLASGNKLVCVGRLVEQKGPLLLVEAAARLRDQGLNFTLVLVGDGPMRGEVERLVARFKLADRVQLAGWLSKADVRRELIEARALVLPSFAEGLPVVLMEALALARPVITTSVAGIPELVESGVSGWLVPPGSVNDLVEAMAGALNASPEVLERMGRVGLDRVARRHSATIEAGKLAALLQPIDRDRAAVERRAAVFLDRDGTIIEHVHYLSDPAEVRLLPGVPEALRKLNDAGFELVVVTNQSAIGRGMLTLEQLATVNKAMEDQLLVYEVSLAEIYHCPEVPEGNDQTSITHPDRKPGPGMLLRGSSELGIDLKSSWMVGDMVSDVLAGINAGCRGSILVLTGKGLTDLEKQGGPGYVVARDLEAAAEIILNSSRTRD